jgi:hypothetical protein
MGTDHLEDLCIDGLYKNGFSKSGMWWHGLDIPRVPRIGTSGGGGTCECDNEPSDSIKRGEFLD